MPQNTITQRQQIIIDTCPDVLDPDSNLSPNQIYIDYLESRVVRLTNVLNDTDTERRTAEHLNSALLAILFIAVFVSVIMGVWS